MIDRPAARRITNLEWFGLALPAGLLAAFFVAPFSAALLALSLGATAAACYAAGRREPVAIWLAVLATGVFALVAGSFIHGFVRHPELRPLARVLEGGAETLAVVWVHGQLPLEGAPPLAPWRHVAGAWAVFSLAGMLLCHLDAKRRAASTGAQAR